MVVFSDAKAEIRFQSPTEPSFRLPFREKITQKQYLGYHFWVTLALVWRTPLNIFILNQISIQENPMKLNLVRFAALAALTVSASAAFASPIIPMPNPTKGFAASRVQGGFSPIIPMPNPTKG